MLPDEPEPEVAPEPRPTLRDLLPHSLDEALPLLVVPACSLAWVLDGGSPRRALAGLLGGTLAALAIHVVLRRFGRESPLSRALPLVGALAGWPLRALPMSGGALLLAAALALFRPKLVAARGEEPSDPEEHVADESDGLGQSELPFGVFLGVAAIVALLWGDDIVRWYVSVSVRGFGGAP